MAAPAADGAGKTSGSCCSCSGCGCGCLLGFVCLFFLGLGLIGFFGADRIRAATAPFHPRLPACTPDDRGTLAGKIAALGPATAPVSLTLTQGELNAWLARVRVPLQGGLAIDSMQAGLRDGVADLYLQGSGLGLHDLTVRVVLRFGGGPGKSVPTLDEVWVNRAQLPLDRVGFVVEPWLAGWHERAFGFAPAAWSERLQSARVASGTLEITGQIRDVVERGVAP